ncbi:MAG: aminotransferase class I/II-fold pyridoxal phosphate-dependent enzyme [Ruminococcus sp.]|jgi:aspartate/methionine/tyrosine aminotransferase|nr:aminotransferase class I/II-fold pyridoxal phosphate-dependent enzyme [Ruminococcus sp.]
MLLSEMNKSELETFKAAETEKFNAFKSQGLKLNMSRGVHSTEQLDLSMPILEVLHSSADMMSEDGTDCRNYGNLTGISEAKRLFASLLGVKDTEIIIGGNSSLALMYDTVSRAFSHGVYGSVLPWGKLPKVKFLCPVPGYDRHFGICENFSIEMINIPMSAAGPDMDLVEKLVAEDDSIKGIWCVPLYSNPDGIIYSDETVKRFAALSPKASDFRIFWDNAYVVHHLTDKENSIPNIFDELRKNNKEDMIFEFASTSKITFPGAGVAVLGASENNIKQISDILKYQIISYDKLNQLRHVRYFGDLDGIRRQMLLHRAILEPKFNLVCETLEKELKPLGIIDFIKPEGGYFVSAFVPEGCAKGVVKICKEGGVTLTGAGATYPYGHDPKDSNIRIAPTFPPLDELGKALELFCIAVKLQSAEKLLKDNNFTIEGTDYRDDNIEDRF